MTDIRLTRNGAFWVGEFRAMASPCEVHVEHDSQEFAAGLVKLAMNEALRIERAFSRYRDDNAVWSINNSGGKPVEVDVETARMLNFAHTCHGMSDGLFDITSGVLRSVWDFNGSDDIPSASDIETVLPCVGWCKVEWNSPVFTLPKGMQIDLGGIGKEYAVDRSVALLNAAASEVPCLVNFGGDLHANRPPLSKSGWNVGVEAARADGQAVLSIQLLKGALTTSGDAQRFLLKDGIRYGHVLNPHTGWPAQNAPASVTVAGNSCLEAGILSTLAILKGADAESFLEEQDVKYWCQR
ncbi:MAG: FAD:protein FMN transferase [Granulosicoccus sp.]